MKKPTPKHLILFDDTCTFCWRSTYKLRTLDRKGICYFSPLSGDLAKAILKKKWNALSKANTVVLVENYTSSEPQIWTKGRAVTRIFWLMGNWRKLIGALSFMPSFLIDPLYSFVAKRRHRI